MFSDFLVSVLADTAAAAATAAPAIGATATADAGGGGLGNYGGILMLVPMFAVFYFLLIRPQQKRQKAHQEFVRSLKRGTDVVTNSGLMGRIAAITDNVALIEIAPNVRVKVQRGQIASVASDADLEAARMATAALSAGGGKKSKAKAGKPVEPVEEEDAPDDSGEGDGDTDGDSAEKAAS